MKKFCFVFENFCLKLFFLVRFWLMDSLLLFVVRRFFSSVFLFWLNIRYTMMMMMGSWDAFCLFVCLFLFVFGTHKQDSLAFVVVWFMRIWCILLFDFQTLYDDWDKHFFFVDHNANTHTHNEYTMWKKLNCEWNKLTQNTLSLSLCLCV